MVIIPEGAGKEHVAQAFNVSRESLKKLQAYVVLLSKWQKKINLVGPKEMSRIWSRHIADGLQLADRITKPDQIGIDLGSGAGIPGIIMAIALQSKNIHFHLVESNGKKATFLREAVRQLEVSADVHGRRIESLYNEEWVSRIDFVVARALSPLPKLVEQSAPFVKNSGDMLFLKGLDVDSELTQTTKCWNIQYEKYPSRTHANGCILNIKDVNRVAISK